MLHGKISDGDMSNQDMSDQAHDDVELPTCKEDVENAKTENHGGNQVLGPSTAKHWSIQDKTEVKGS
jgi:hypothetical protein